MSILYRLIQEGWLEQFNIDINSLSNQDLDFLLEGKEIKIKNKLGKWFTLSLKDSGVDLQAYEE